ncbi:MAG TPA: ABC transporter substrate-binding protein [Pyrinomonadaceae bacterium]|nr:ABC transporter substrate-binding protein [Pyrinomonadaceae bacterium]
MRKILLLISILSLLASIACRRANTEYVTLALPEAFTTFDTLTTEKSDAAAERLKNLMFSGLVKKTETFDYVGDLASEIKTSEDGKAITFVLRDNVKFHNGAAFTSKDVKYTFDELFKAKGYKSFAFFDTVNKQPVAHLTSIETPDDKTVIFNLRSASIRNQLLANLVAIPIVAEGTAGQLKTQPIGSGAFKFVSFDASQNIVELAAFSDYWEGAPKVAKLRVKTVTDASALQAELQTGGVDIAAVPSNLPPDAIKILDGVANLKVEQFDGSNIQYLGFNTQDEILKNSKIRQAIGYAIDREKIIRELLSGQAKAATSILPATSWAYTPGTVYAFDPAKSKQLIQEAGYNRQPIRFKYASGNAAFNSMVQAIQSSLLEVGLNVEILPVDPNTLRQEVAQGQYQMNTGIWIGGNQDPIFLRDLFTKAKIPGEGVSCCNRWRYSNEEVDKLLEAAFNEPDRAKAKELYTNAWNIISAENPLYPLWYPANMVIYNKRIGNIKLNASGDWSFAKDITVQ